MIREIVISRMYSGKYLRLNLGHEIINMFKADDGKHYIYLNDLGTFGKAHIDAKGNLSIESVLLTHTIEGTNAVEVLGVAKGLHAIYNPLKSDEENAKVQSLFSKSVKYGGVPVSEIFAGNEGQDVFFTFEADEVLRVAEGKHIYIKMAAKGGQVHHALQVNEKDIIVCLGNVKMGQGLKTYVSEGTDDFDTIDGLIKDSANWENTIHTVAKSSVPVEMSLLTVCGREADEVAYSNALAYFLKKYPSLLEVFLNQQSNYYEFVVEREVGRTDILCYNSTNLIIIENKIKSGLNGKKKDDNGIVNGTQLDDYENFSEMFKNKHCPKASLKYYLLVPDYYHYMDHSNLRNFTVFYYSRLYEFLVKRAMTSPFSKDAAFNEFVKAIEPHTHLTDDSLYRDMIRRFHERIDAIMKRL